MTAETATTDEATTAAEIAGITDVTTEAATVTVASVVSAVTTTTGAAEAAMIATAMDETTTTGDHTAALPVMIGGASGIDGTVHTAGTVEIDETAESVDSAATDTTEADKGAENGGSMVTTAKTSTVIAVMKMTIITIALVTRMNATVAEKELA